MSKLSELKNRLVSMLGRVADHISLSAVDKDALTTELGDLLGDLFDGRQDGDPEIRAFIADMAQQAVGMVLGEFTLRLSTIEQRLGLNNAEFPVNGADPTLAPPVLTGDATVVETIKPEAEVPADDNGDAAYREAGFKFNPVTGAALG